MSKQIQKNLNQNHGGRPKAEPKPTVVHPGGVNMLGYAMGPGGTPDRLFGGEGFKKTPGASVDPPTKPGGGRTVHHCGSQGKHK